MKKKIFSLILILSLLFSCFATTVGAIVSQKPVYTEGGTVEGKEDAFVAIKSELEAYQHSDTFTVENDGYIGIPVDITIYNDPTTTYEPSTPDTMQYPYETTEPNYNSATKGGKPVALYVINTNTERVGTESDVNIITSLLKEGYIVAVIDYKNEKRAKSPDLDWSLQRVRAQITGKKLAEFTDPELKAWLTFNYILPAGYSIKRGVQFFNFEEHGAYGVLDFFVDVWNVDLKYTGGSFGKGDKVSVIWGQKELYDGTKVYQDASGVRCIPQGDGYVYYTQNADYSYTVGEAVADPTTVTPLYKSVTDDAVWVNEETREIKVRYTNAEDFWDCVKPSGERMDLNLYADIYYPTSPENEVPVMILASSSQNRAGATQTADRPISTGYMFTGYAFVNYDHAYVPMSRADHFDYFEGDAALDRNSNFTVVGQAGVEAQTAAIRIVRYLAERYNDIFHFDVDKFGVWGHSKGAHVNFLAEEHPEEKINQDYFPGHTGEVPENQPWMTYSDGTPIPSNVQFLYPSKGGNGGYVTTNVPFFISHPEADTYLSENARYAILLASARGANVPSFAVTMEGVGHTTVHGYNEVLDVDMYQALFDFTDYFLYDRPSTYSYSLPINGTTNVGVTDDIVLKFTGPIPESEITGKVRIINTKTGESARGIWESACGGNEWVFHPMGLEGGNTYRIEVPDDLIDEKGNAIKQKKSVTYFRTSYENTFKATEVVSSNGSLTLSRTESDANGVYFVFDPLQIDHSFGTFLRFSSTSDASTAVNVYGIIDLNENDLSASTLTATPIQTVGIAGAEIVEVDVSEYIASLSEGTKPAFYVEAAKSAGTTTIYDCNFDDASSRGPLASKSSKYWTASPNGTTAYTVANGKSYFLSNIFTNAITKADYGRRIRVSFDVYSTISRDFFARFTVAKVVPQTSVGEPGYQYVDNFNNTGVTVMLKAGEWQRVTVDYLIDDYTYTEDYIQKISLHFGTSGREIETVYIDNLLVTDTVADATISDVDTMSSIKPTLAVKSAVLTESDAVKGGYVVNGDESDKVFDAEDGYHISGPSISGVGDVRVSYFDIDLTALDFSTPYVLGLKITKGNGKILAYGLNELGMEGFDIDTLTYQNAPAFDRGSVTAIPSQVHGGAPIASVDATVGNTYMIALTRYLLDMKAAGQDHAVVMLMLDASASDILSFSLISNVIETTVMSFDFDEMESFTSSNTRHSTDADAILQLPVNTDTAVASLDSTVFYGASGKSLKISNNGGSDFFSSRITHWINIDKTAARFTSEDLGKTVYVSMKLYIPSTDPYTDGSLKKIYVGMAQTASATPEGGYNYYGTSTGKLYNPQKLLTLDPDFKAGEWCEISYSFTVIDQMVGAGPGAFNADTRPINLCLFGTRGDAYIDELRFYTLESTQTKEFGSTASTTVEYTNKTECGTYHTQGGSTSYQYLTLEDALDGHAIQITSNNTYDRIFVHNLIQKLGFDESQLGQYFTYVVRAKFSKAGSFVLGLANRQLSGTKNIPESWGLPAARTVTIAEEDVGKWIEIEYSFTLTQSILDVFNAQSGDSLPDASGTWKYNGSERFGLRFYLDGFGQTSDDPLLLEIDRSTCYLNALPDDGNILTSANNVTASLNGGTTSDPSIGASLNIDYTLKKGYFAYTVPSYSHLYQAILSLKAQAHSGREFRLWALTGVTMPEVLTWNNAPANDLAGEGALVNYAFGGAPIATFVFDENGNATVDVTDYINRMGSGEVIFLVTAIGANAEDGDAIIEMPTLSLYTEQTPDRAFEQAVAGHNVVITDTLTYNLYFNTDKNIASVEYEGVSFDFDTLADVSIDGITYKRMSFTTVAKDAFKLHTVTVYLEDGSFAVYDINIRRYLEQLYNTSDTAEIKDLAADMLSYLAASIMYFNADVDMRVVNGAKAILDSTLGAGYDEAHPALGLEDAVAATATDSGMSGAGMNLAERPTFYFIAAEGYENETPVFTLDGKEVAYERVEEGDKVYYLLAISPIELTETVSWTIGDKSGSFNLRAYYDWAKDVEKDATLVHLVERLWRYAESVQNYFN